MACLAPKGMLSMDERGYPNNLKVLRKAAGLTQEQLADLLGTSAQLVSFYETGRRRLNQTTIDRLSRFFKVSPNDLLGFELEDGGESKILDIYRKLSDEDKQMAVSILQTLSARNSS